MAPFAIPWNIFDLEEYPPGGAVPLIFFGLGLCTMVLSFLLALVMVVAKRKSPAVKSKQPTQVLMGYVACVGWFIGYSFSMKVLPQNSILCIPLKVWLQQMGLSMFTSLVLSRQIILFFVFYFPGILKFLKRKKIPASVLQILQVVLNMPLLIYCIVASVPHWGAFDHENCAFTTVGVITVHSISVLIIIAIVLMAILTIRIRKEFREIKVYTFFAIMMTSVSAFLFIMWFFQLSRHPATRIAMIGAPWFGGNCVLFATLGECMLRFLFCQHRWFNQWIDKFHANSQQMLSKSLLKHGGKGDELGEDGEYLKDDPTRQDLMPHNSTNEELTCSQVEKDHFVADGIDEPTEDTEHSSKL